MGFLSFLKEEEEKKLEADQEDAIDSLEDVNSEDDEEIAKMDLDEDELEEVEELTEKHIRLGDDLAMCGAHPDDPHPETKMNDHGICPECDNIAHMVLTGQVSLGKVKASHDQSVQESVVKKKGLDILKGRYKHNSRLLTLKKMSGDSGDISPRTIALFKLTFEYNPKMGRYGKWMIRRNKKKYIEAHPIVGEVKKIKKKRKKLKLLKRRGDVKAKQKRGKKVAKQKTAGRTVDHKGKTVVKK
jgi:hypothetical protein